MSRVELQVVHRLLLVTLHDQVRTKHGLAHRLERVVSLVVRDLHQARGRGLDEVGLILKPGYGTARLGRRDVWLLHHVAVYINSEWQELELNSVCQSEMITVHRQAV